MAKDPFDFSDVFADVEKKINDIMHSPSAKKQLQEHARFAAYEYVYPLYGSMGSEIEGVPKGYIRRYASGGLGDPNKNQVITDMLEMTVINNTPGNGEQPGEQWTSGPINDIIEKGVGYGWRHSDIYGWQPYPRPFMEKGLDEFTDEYLLPEIHKQVFEK